MMSRTRIKVCGMTDQAEATAIAALGVDALGFIFVASSPRCIEVEKAKAIIASLPPFIHAVGVFMDEEAARVNAIAHDCGLTLIQLHGHESPGYCRAMSRPVLKAFRIGENAPADLAPYHGLVKGFLLDTYRPGQAGGTGEAFNWELLQRLTIPGPLLLAGGLTPDNVASAIRQTHPFAVDINSGVEISPGRKDLGLIRQLIAEVKDADRDTTTAPLK